MENKELEILKAEIEQFKVDAMKMFFVQTWAETYKTDPFGHMVDDVRGVFWLKAQAYQLWQFWKAAKQQATPEGFVLIGKECPDPIFADNLFADLKTRSFICDDEEFINLCDIDPIVVWKMVIEAQEQSHDNSN